MEQDSKGPKASQPEAIITGRVQQAAEKQTSRAGVLKAGTGHMAVSDPAVSSKKDAGIEFATTSGNRSGLQPSISAPNLLYLPL